MTFFVDANILVYSASAGRYRSPCLEILRAIAVGGADGKTSPAVMEEMWFLELSAKAGDLRGLTRRSYTVLAPLLPVTDEIFLAALSLRAPNLGANDRIHAATCLNNGIRTIVSADSGFDGIAGLRRVDPLDERAWKSLIASR
ncbi:PIN domain-containing protein [bacterium]|nr:MAG: PIN domain-containing protein [bacterium]